jgi:excisionase family DNA binding protein
MENNGLKLIIGISKLAERLDVSRPTISQFIKMGMPCGRVGNRWHFHLENVDRWLKKDLTNARYEGKEDPESLEDQDQP